MSRKRQKPAPVSEAPVLVLFHPPEPCARCQRDCWTACPDCGAPFCLAHIYDHHSAAHAA
jgi:hypothetical protein